MQGYVKYLPLFFLSLLFSLNFFLFSLFSSLCRGQYSQIKKFYLILYKNKIYYLNFKLIVRDIKAYNSNFYV